MLIQADEKHGVIYALKKACFAHMSEDEREQAEDAREVWVKVTRGDKSVKVLLHSEEGYCSGDLSLNEYLGKDAMVEVEIVEHVVQVVRTTVSIS